MESSGKVRAFGVSNHTPCQLDLLKTDVTQPIIANQVQLSLTHTAIIAQCLIPNMTGEDDSFSVKASSSFLPTGKTLRTRPYRNSATPAATQGAPSPAPGGVIGHGPEHRHLEHDDDHDGQQVPERLKEFTKGKSFGREVIQEHAAVRYRN